MKKILFLLTGIALLMTAGCKKDFLNTEPSTDITGDSFLKSYDMAVSLISGVIRDRFAYDGNTHQFSYGEHAATGFVEYFGGDFFALGPASYGAGWGTFQQLPQRMDNSRAGAQPWNKFYRMINPMNQLISNIPKMPELKDAQAAYLEAQAKAFRAHFYHLLVQMYAQAVHHSPDEPGVPLFLTPSEDPTNPSLVPRSTVAEVYAQIEKDLKDAELKIQVPGAASLRIDNRYISLNVIRGLLSRIYLDKHDYVNAAIYANLARTGVQLMSQTQFADGFLTQNGEWMWASIVPGSEANSYATFPAELSNTGSYYPAAWGFVNCISTKVFEATDTSKDCRFKGLLVSTKSVNYPNQMNRYDKYRWSALGSKYDLVYMRGAEMLLNEAEALCMQGGKDNEVKALLTELITARVDAAYAAKVNTMSADDLYEEVKMQRRIEFWGENGRRFFDLKRRGEVLDCRGNGSDEMNTYMPGFLTVSNPKSMYWLYLIPRGDMTSNSTLVQNNYPF